MARASGLRDERRDDERTWHASVGLPSAPHRSRAGGRGSTRRRRARRQPLYCAAEAARFHAARRLRIRAVCAVEPPVEPRPGAPMKRQIADFLRRPHLFGSRPKVLLTAYLLVGLVVV